MRVFLGGRNEMINIYEVGNLVTVIELWISYLKAKK